MHHPQNIYDFPPRSRSCLGSGQTAFHFLFTPQNPQGRERVAGILSEMDNDDPFDNFGLDFRSVGGYLSKPYVQSSNNEYEHTYLLNGTPIPSRASTYVKNSCSTVTTTSSDCGQVLFLSGYPTPEQVNRLSTTHNINPEFWHRHLAASAPTLEDTKLPSAYCDIFQLRFWTVAALVNTFRHDRISVQSLRKDAEVDMVKYRNTLKSLASWRPGDSVVRNYEIHDHFSIEQTVTMCVVNERDSKSIDKGCKWLGEWHATQLRTQS
jgi:hypothetical protein